MGENRGGIQPNAISARMSRFLTSWNSHLTTAPSCHCGATALGTSAGNSPRFSPGLLDRLSAWQQEFDDNYHWDSGWRSAEIRDRWASEAGELAADVRAELGTRAELVVRLWPLHA